MDQLYFRLAQWFIARARKLHAQEDLGFDLKETLYALDPTAIDLCLDLFQWARFRRHKAAVKLHTLFDLRGAIPTFILITEGKLHDANILDELPLEAGAYYGQKGFGRRAVARSNWQASQGEVCPSLSESLPPALRRQPLTR